MEENNMELMNVMDDLNEMTDGERDVLQKLIASMIVGIFHSINRDVAVENIKKEFENVVGEEVTDNDLADTFGENGISEVLDVFSNMTTDGVANVISEFGLNTFAEVGYRISQQYEPEKLTAAE